MPADLGKAPAVRRGPIAGRAAMTTVRFLRLVLLAAGLSATTPAWAQPYEPARLLGFGQARRALGSGSDAIFVNPAGLSFSPTYELEASYADDFRSADRRVSVSVADGQAGEVSGGLALTYNRFRPPDEPDGDLRLEGLRFDVGTSLALSPGFALGATGRYADYRLLQGDEALDGQGESGFGFDLGFQWRLADGLALGGTMQNVTAVGRPRLLPRAWGAGVGFRTGAFTIEADVSHAWESEDPRYTGAVGYVLGQFPLRLAVTYSQETSEVLISGGAGVTYDKIALDVGYRQAVNPRGDETDADQRLFVATLRVRVF